MLLQKSSFRLFLQGILLLGGCLWGQSIQAQDLDAAPTTLPTMDFDWQEAVLQLSDVKYIQAFVLDPNYETSEYLDKNQSKKTALLAVLGQETASKIFYQWIKPRVQENWNGLSYYEQACLRKALLHCQDYLATFSLGEEQAYYEACKNNKVQEISPNYQHLQFHRPISGVDRFVRWSPKGDYYDANLLQPKPASTTLPYRRLEAFLFRRIATDGIKITQLQYFINQLLQDCSVPQNETVSSTPDERILEETMTFKKGKLQGKVYRKTDFYYTTVTTGRYVTNQKVGWWTMRDYRDEKLAYEIKERYQKDKLVERNYVMYSNGKPYLTIWYSVSKKKYKTTKWNRKTEVYEVEKEGRFFEAAK